MKQIRYFLFVAGVMFALALTFSCTEETGGDDPDNQSSSSGGGTGNSSSSGEVDNGLPNVEVSTVAEFIAAIGSNKNILMKEGAYNLSDYYSQNVDGDFEHEYLYWEYMELHIKDVENMTIRGTGETRSKVITENPSVWVMIFENVKNVSIKNVIAGHEVQDGCDGGVFRFVESSNITIEDSYLYGSGLIGLSLYDVNGLKMKDSYIDECTEALMQINQSNNLSFENSYFWDTRGPVYINYTTNTVFDGCEFSGNTIQWGSLFTGEDNEDVVIKNSEFYENDANALVYDYSGITVDSETCEFEDNTWDNEGDDDCEGLDEEDYYYCIMSGGGGWW